MVSAFSTFVRKFGWLTTPLVMFVFVYGFFFSVIYPKWHIYSRIVHWRARTEGVITAKEPMNHAGIRYEYSVAGHI